MDIDIGLLRRIKPDNMKPKIYANTVVLYLFCLEYARKKKVLDAACGEGYGSFLLSTVADWVIGIDIDSTKIIRASKNYYSTHLDFLRMDVTRLAFPDQYFDLIVSVETLEHLSETAIERFLCEITRTLRGEGTFVITTPNRPVYSSLTKTKGHISEKSVSELRDLLIKYFGSIKFYFESAPKLKPRSKAYSIIRRVKEQVFSLIPIKLANKVRQIFIDYQDRRKMTNLRILLAPRMVREPSQGLQEVEKSLFQVAICHTPLKRL